MHENMRILVRISLDFVPHGLSNFKSVSISSDKGLVSNWRQAIIWAYRCLLYRRIYELLGLDELPNIRMKHIKVS